jgi:predicted SAM-dependent methyltransferase
MPGPFHDQSRAPEEAQRLHIGSGPLALPGWVNIDNRPYPGVDRVHDVTEGLPFHNVQFIFAEHFIEHLDLHQAMDIFLECRRVLRDDGVLRLSTPNLDWVWASHYKRVMTEGEAVLACFAMNRAFHGWGHQFLYNETTLRSLLLDAGFASVVRCDYGQSAHSELRGLERHEWQKDFEGLSHILIVEASGRGGQAPDYLAEPRGMFLTDAAVK